MIGFLNKEGIAYLAMGNGSNLLVKDAGIAGVVILLSGSLAELEMDTDDHRMVTAGGGASLADLLGYCRCAGLGGLEFLAGVPGTVGGAVAMNAGAFEESIGDRLRAIYLLNKAGRLFCKDRSQFSYGYRKFRLTEATAGDAENQVQADLSGFVVVKASLRLLETGAESVAARMSHFLKIRRQRQPLDYPSAGSVFKNPPGDHAGRLIEQAGLKGKRIGGAMISEKHANFIVNTGHAKAHDIIDLVHLAQQKVKQTAGVELEPEIRVVGH